MGKVLDGLDDELIAWMDSIPFMAYQGERPTLEQWARRRSDDDLATYWQDRNATSIDGLPALDG